MLIFGLDIGTTSIGFAAVELDEQKGTGKILRLGVRIFPEARDPDGTPLNQQRRAKRMMRRQLRRRRQRRRGLNGLLAAHGLLPAFGGVEWAAVMAADPYALRDRGLDEALLPHELGRALYHLAKRRHFKERDLAEAEAENRKDKAKPEDEAEASTREAMAAALAKSEETLGRHLARYEPGRRKRGEHATRRLVREEFEGLWAAQAPHHPALRDLAFRGAVEEAVFAQRPVFWRKSTLGSCRFIPEAPLCPKGSWLSQQRRMIEKVNNLAIAGGNGRPLDAEERDAILAALATQKSMSWGGVRKALEPLFKTRSESAKHIRFNLEYGDEKGGLKGNIVEAELANVFGAKWAAHPHRAALRTFLPEALWQADYGEIGAQRVVIRPETERKTRREALAGRLVAEFGATLEEAARLTGLHFPQGWEPFSTAALEIFLPELEKGTRFGVLVNGPEWEDWRDEHFPNREQPTGEVLDRLPSPKNHDEARRIATLRNPTVVRVQNELRKVVNNLISAHKRKPDLIRVELAREVGKSKREREEMMAAMRKRERRRKEARADLEANNIAEPLPEGIEKWLLWHECNKECPYTGEVIDFEGLFLGNRFQIEHIWPKSKTLDNSFGNKTLCRADVNRDKGDRTPYEYFRTRPEQAWDEVKLRIDKLVREKLWSNGKARRFLIETPLAPDLTSRQLVDTGYAARQAVDSIKRLWPDLGVTAPVRVQAVSGRVTAQLRRQWELNHILGDDGEKNRADHRHHAIDALVVACADNGYTQKLSVYYQKKKENRVRPPPLEKPWPAIRVDAQAAIGRIVVSHRVRKKASGALHLETTYGDTGRDVTTKSGTYRLFVSRKPVERLSKSELDEIADPHIRQVVKDWVAARGGDPKKAFGEVFPRVSENGPEIRKVRLHGKQQISLMAKVSTGYADLGRNHHVAIFRDGEGRIVSEAVSLFEVARRIARREPPVRRDRGDGSAFVMSLALGDTLHFPSEKMNGYWIVQSIWSAGQIVLHRAEDAEGSSVVRPVASSLIRDGARKVAVDPIGRVRKAGD